MSLSIWEYLRARTRDAVLAGFNDAFDIAEQGDTNGGQHLAANRLALRLAPPELKGLPEPSQNGPMTPEGASAQGNPPDPLGRPAGPARLDDAFERRIDAAASQRAGGTPPATVASGRLTHRKRGRPPKNRQDQNP